MKKGIIIFAVGLISHISHLNSLCAQTLSPVASPTSGDYYNPGGNSLSFTVGETYQTTLTGGINMLTQGMQQAEPCVNPVVSASNVTLCSGGTTNIMLSSSVSGSTFSWTSTVISGSVVGNGSCASLCGTSISDILNDVGSGNGVVQYMVTATSPLGCTSAPFAVTATLGTVPTAPVVSGLTAICGVVNPTYTATSTFATTYTWTMPTGITITSGQGTSAIVTHQASFNTPDYMTVAASNSCGTSTTTSVLITKKPLAPGAISGPTSTCSQTSATWSIAPVAAATSYSWTVPTGMTIISGVGTTQITVNISPTFIIGNVKVNAVNACGNVAGPSLTVTGNVPSPPIYLYGAANVCGLTTTTYSASVTAAYGASGYFWTVPSWMTITSGQGTSLIAVNITGTPVAGNTVTVSGTNVCGTGAAKVLTISTSAVQPASITGPTNTCALTSATYTCSSVAGGVSYQWTPATGQTIVSGQGTTMLTVSILVSSTTTTSNSFLKVVSVNACGVSSAIKQIVITRCLSPDAMVSGVGEEVAFVIYPNPCASQLGIRNYELGMGVVEMYDMLGNRVLQSEITNPQSEMSVDVSALAKGIYLVRILSEGTQVFSQTVIKQ